MTREEAKDMIRHYGVQEPPYNDPEKVTRAMGVALQALEALDKIEGLIARWQTGAKHEAR